MDRKKELKELYKLEKRVAGVFQIKNTHNQKVFLKSTMNLNSINGQLFQLNYGGHPNKVLQKEWREFGKDAFVFETLAIIEQKEGQVVDMKNALKKLESEWFDRLTPFGERGYN